ncbi:MAG: MBL fold metallo-hydrolase [Bifidobacteriaceae bacterium]|jgi:ribonuclease BN (tRNA processing enzyme)|nr:MBL fold metallo-hydrolase [Bifidobacteriaceae bacterium]
MKLMIIGCTGSLPGPTSPASSYLVQTRDQSGRLWSIAMDMGSGAFGVLQSVLPPEALDFVGLSHLHPDHCADLTGLAVYAKYRPGAAMSSLPVYGPADTPHHLAELQYSHDPNADGGDFNYGSWSEEVGISVGPFVITPFKVAHPVEAWGFRVEGPSDIIPGKRVTLSYSGDTDTCEGLTGLAAGADLLLIEAAFEELRDVARGVHLTGRRAGQVARAARARQIVLTHLPPWNDPAITLEAASAAYPGPIYLARHRASYVI